MATDLNLWHRHERLSLKIEMPFARQIYREKNRFIRQQAINAVKTHAVSDLDFDEHKINMARIFEVYIQKTIRLFSNETESFIVGKKHLMNLEKKAFFWELLYIQWITERGAEAVKQSAGTTRDDVRKILITAQASETAIAPVELTKRILRTRGLSRWRAATIARTETGMAASNASIQTAKKISADTGLQMKKRWIPALDGRTRDSHGAMAGSQAIGMEAKFFVGGARMDRPKDPAGGRRNVINCRCTMVFETE